MLSTESSEHLERQMLSVMSYLIQIIEERQRSPIRNSLRRWGGIMLMTVAFFLGMEILLSPYAPVVLNAMLSLLPFTPLITEILFFSFPVILLVAGYRVYYYSSNSHVAEIEDQLILTQENLYPHPEVGETDMETPHMESIRTDSYEPHSLPEENRATENVSGREMSV